jgi:hypothetical protein
MSTTGNNYNITKNIGKSSSNQVYTLYIKTRFFFGRAKSYFQGGGANT